MCPGSMSQFARDNGIELTDLWDSWPEYMNEKGSHLGWRDLGCTCVPLCNLESMCPFFGGGKKCQFLLSPFFLFHGFCVADRKSNCTFFWPNCKWPFLVASKLLS